MIPHNQAPSPAVNLSGVAINFEGATVNVSGHALIFGVERPVSYTGDLVEGEALYLDAQGGIGSTQTPNTIAHLAWREADGVHFIKHVAQESA